MASAPDLAREELILRARRVQWLSIGWMSVEACVSLLAAWQARSTALLAFGGDSAIELASAVIVLNALRRGSLQPDAERRASRLAAVLLFALAAYVVAAASANLLGYVEPQPSRLGIAILAAAVVVMPWLAREKRKLSAAIGSAAIRADSTQSGLCAYLAAIALAGLAVNYFWNVRWADPLAALAIVPLVLWEAREAYRGKPCGCH